MAGLYIHIPYCHSKCAYCDFYSSPNTSQLNDLVDAIGKEWQLRRNEVSDAIETVYIGGGTPSILNDIEFRNLISYIKLDAQLKEFTIEANPDDVSERMSDVWLNNGVNRVSMGIQSFDDAQLQFIGRRHSSQQAVNAVKILRNSGVNNISLDLIYGLPGQTLQSWKKSLDKLLEIRPQHFSAYILSYENGTRLYAQLITGKVSEADEDLIDEMYSYLCDAAGNAGYEHYEISNFALPGYRAIHNANYWKFLPYIGLGPSAHSFDGEVRRINPSSIKSYIDSLQQNKLAATIEPETLTDKLNDKIMVGLRTSDGLDLSTLTDDQAESLYQRMKTLPLDHIQLKDNKLSIPEHRYLVSDAIIRTLLA
jgi:oxygen-independent coproporphyrinogen-3 oxidase